MEKPFIISCPKCRWKEMSSGLAADLTHLTEIKNHCSNCGKPRSFRCLRCGGAAKMLRVNRRVG